MYNEKTFLTTLLDNMYVISNINHPEEREKRREEAFEIIHTMIISRLEELETYCPPNDPRHVDNRSGSEDELLSLDDR